MGLPGNRTRLRPHASLRLVHSATGPQLSTWTSAEVAPGEDRDAFHGRLWRLLLKGRREL